MPPGTRIEVCYEGFKLARHVAELVNDSRSAGGSALVIDYGQDTISGASLRVRSQLARFELSRLARF